MIAVRFSRFSVAVPFLCGVAVAIAAFPVLAEGLKSPAPDDAAAYQRAVEKAVQFLRTQGQSDDGSYSGFTGSGVTSVVTTGLLRNGRTPNDPLVAKSLRYLEKNMQADGGAGAPESALRNYETCLALLCFVEANRDGRYDKTVKKAELFLKGLQWDEDEGHNKSSEYYGGAGYGTHERPDLSNTSFLIEALKAAGNGPDDEAMQKALIFVNRCQNLETEHNTTKFAGKIADGSMYYTPAAGGTSQAGETANGGLRGYGSMTYAGLKSMIYAGVGPDDPRVKAAFEWASKHYDLKTNPGMGDAGLYYYYHMFAKALDAMDIDEIEDADGVKHDWRAELRAELVSKQRADGSWTNKNDRWLEGDPSLVSGYVLLTLSYCRPEAEK